jgi:hypothetical protein
MKPARSLSKSSFVATSLTAGWLAARPASRIGSFVMNSREYCWLVSDQRVKLGNMRTPSIIPANQLVQKYAA